MKSIMYFATWCLDTEPFFSELNRLGTEFNILGITNGRLNFKAFLRLRDTHSVFDDAKQNGYIGIPALVLENRDVVLDKDEIRDVVKFNLTLY